MKEVALVASLFIRHWFLFLYILRYSLQYTLMLPLEVVDPGGSLSMLLVATAYWRRRQSESVLASGNGAAAYSCDWTEMAHVFGLGNS